MRQRVFCLAILLLLCADCCIAKATGTRVYAADRGISQDLDLEAVGAVFARSSTVKEFEDRLNDPSYKLSNLDLNGDGYLDYLRVVETVDGFSHSFVIQAVLGDNVYKDVATLIADVSKPADSCVRIIGAPYVFGMNCVIEPVYAAAPLIFTHLAHAAYRAWVSPWHWNHYPPVFRRTVVVCANHRHIRPGHRYVDHRYDNRRFANRGLNAPRKFNESGKYNGLNRNVNGANHKDGRGQAAVPGRTGRNGKDNKISSNRPERMRPNAPTGKDSHRRRKVESNP